MATEITFHGVRGSYPTTGPETQGYGGDTLCVRISTPNATAIIDAGSGLLRTALPEDIHVLLTHYHHDHILALPYISALYGKDKRVTLYGERKDGVGPRDALTHQLGAPWFPRDENDIACDLSERVIAPGDAFRIGDLSFTAVRLNHPQGSLGYLCDTPEGKVGFVWDHEHGDESIDKRLRATLRGVDTLIYDTCYTREEQEGPKRGWGHSTPEEATRLATDVEARALYLTHHAPERTDAQVTSIVAQARERFAGTHATRQGSKIIVGNGARTEG